MVFGNSSLFGSLQPAHICGCYYSPPNNPNDRIYLPQVKLESHTTLTPISYTTKLTQTFRNENLESTPQIRYTFPLYDGAAVNGYVISYADKKLKGIVKQKEVAKQTYQAAVDRGETAGLLESLPAGIFGVTLGNVPAKTDIVVEISYCGELKHDAGIDGLRWTLPTSIAPRYGSYPGKILNRSSIPSSGIKITVDADMAGSAIRKVTSTSHPITVSMGAISQTESTGASFQPSQACAELALGTTELGDDFVVQLQIDDSGKPQAIIESHPAFPNQRAIMATLVPKFVLPSANPEIVFIADQSGSMGGAKNTALVKALNVFLKSLPFGVRFNICAFGNSFKFLWPKSQAYSESSLKKAISFVNSFQANYGGTEILEPIKTAFKQRHADLPLEVMLLTDGEVWGEHEIFNFINTEIHENKTDARVFTLGIGRDVSHTLVEGVARAGNGFSQFVTENEQTTDKKVIRMLKAALYGHTKDYSLVVNYKDDKGEASSDTEEFEIVEKVNDCLKIQDSLPKYTETEPTEKKSTTSFFDQSVDLDKPIDATSTTADRYAHLPAIAQPKAMQAPSAIPPLFPFSRTTVYLLLGPETAQKKVASVTLRATCSTGPLELTIPVHKTASTGVATCHQLAARKAIQELEEGRGWLHNAQLTTGDNDLVSVKKKYESRFDELVEREVVNLGERYQVVSKWTSFVAVEDGNESNAQEDQDAVMVEIETPGKSKKRHLGRDQSLDRNREQRKRHMEQHQSRNRDRDPHLLPPRMQLRALPQDLNRTNRDRAVPDENSPRDRRPPWLTTPITDIYEHSRRSIQQPVMRSCAAPTTRMRKMASPAPPPPGGASSFGAAGGMSAYGATSAFGQSDIRLSGGTAPVYSAQASSLFGASAPAPAPAAQASNGSGGLFGTTNWVAPPLPPQGSTPSLFGRSSQPVVPQEACKDEEEEEEGMAMDEGLSLFSDWSAAGSHTLPATSLDFATGRRASPTGTASSTGINQLHAVIDLQSFSGAWGWDSKLFKLLSMTESRGKVFKNRVEKDLGRTLSKEACTTLLVVAFLRTKLAGEKDVWEMVEQKALDWLAEETTLDKAALDGVLEKAAEQL